MIRAIFFDAGHTLLDVYGVPKNQLFRVMVEKVVQEAFPERKWKEATRESERFYEKWRHDKSYVHSDEYRKVYYSIGLSSLGISPKESERYIVNLLHTNRFKLSRQIQVTDGGLEIIQELKERGYRLGVISNWDGTLQKVLIDLGIVHYFDVIVDSDWIGVRKPSPFIFQHAIAQLGLPPRQILHIGDSYHADFLGAQRSGMRALLLDSLEMVEITERIHSLSELLDHPWLNGEPSS
ncbi:HAD family hydrolase [Risungbinella massiliensis]|uniref:HAD family hydrolase n=1 Tax=Risungbinella massiliensis TaxID=1329796 RepID=UPI00069C4E06|nr:HAD family hydrolase [Risungbinella massiliensis]